MDVLRERLSDSLRALGDVFANPNLRRVELASAGSVVAYWSYGVALAVFAYREGGPAAVGLLGLVRMLPSAFGAPFTALLGDRYPRQRVMLGADVVSAVAVGVSAGAIAADAPAAIVFGLAGLVQLISTASAPARSALLPSLARSPEELTAANVASTTIESVGSFAGPALAGILLAFADLAVVVGLTAGAFLWSALLVARIATDPRPPRGRDDRDGLVREALAGFRAIGAEPDLRLLVGLYAAQTFVAGALSVLIVVMALELLDLGEAGVGFLNSAIGVGGLLGAVAALALVGRRRLVADFRLGLVLWGLPIVLVGVWPDPTLAVLFLAVLGAGNTIVDVAGLTLLQRAVEDRVLARVFGVFESLTWA
ncbi:MAG: MFS transporter, partial [Gaiellaceae bacterium]